MSDLILSDITKEYPTPTEPLRVLRGISCKLSGGENLAIVGPSGSGKSTLLQIMGTLDRPTSGTVSLAGTDPFQLKPNALADFRNENVGFVFQDHHLLPQLTALENVLLPTLAKGNSTAASTSRATGLLEQVGLADRVTHLPGELSGGERQRVAIARALVGQPTLVLADEPTGNLDQVNATSIADVLFHLQESAEIPMIMVVVTHSDRLANRLQRKLTLNDGRLQ